MYSAVAKAVPLETVSVVAPSDLSEGYTFDTVVDGTIMKVKVPSGGVKSGDTFQAIVVSVNEEDNAYELADNAPTGRWRNGLCSCCKFGPCHPMFILACCIPQILLAQVMTRMKLDILAEPGTPNAEWQKTYRKMWIISIIYFFASSALAPDIEVDENGIPISNPTNEGFLSNLLALVFWMYTMYVLIKTRKYVRERYGIPEENCLGCEDLVCSVCCSMCTVSQLASQTADYDVIRAECCSKTGLPEAVNTGEIYAQTGMV